MIRPNLGKIREASERRNAESESWTKSPCPLARQMGEGRCGWAGELRQAGGSSSMAKVGATVDIRQVWETLSQETWTIWPLYACPCFVFWGYSE